jgi:hypothetical protein
MGTDYPGALDNFINPEPTDPRTDPPHASQHSDLNDAVEAIQATLGVNPHGSQASVAARLGVLGMAVIKPSDQSRALDTTATADPDLRFAVVAGEVWSIEARVVYTAVSATPDFKFGFNMAGGTGNILGWWRYIGSDTTANAILVNTGTRQNAASVAAVAAGTIANDFSTILVEAQFRFSHTGTCAFTWAQNTSSADATTVKAGSMLIIRRLLG